MVIYSYICHFMYMGMLLDTGNPPHTQLYEENMEIKINISDTIENNEVVELYKANNWSAANKPDKLLNALRNSHTLVTARVSGKLIGIANAISDNYLVVYYPHLLVHPEYQRNGAGKQMMNVLKEKYTGFHQQMLTADSAAIEFYKAMGFEKAGNTVPMWVYDGNDH